jgi:hypothetical protein
MDEDAALGWLRQHLVAVTDVEPACRNLAADRNGLRLSAEQSTPTQRRHRILSRAMRRYVHGRQLQPPGPLPAPPCASGGCATTRCASHRPAKLAGRGVERLFEG